MLILTHKIKKLTIGVGLFLGGLPVLGLNLFPSVASAAAKAASTATVCKPHQFFGLVPWYQYLELGVKADAAGKNFCVIRNFTFLGNGQSSDIPLVLVAVIDDMLRIAGLVAVGYVLYGSISYITSQGNPESTSKALSTTVNALIGLAIAIVAVAFVSFIGNQLGGK